MDGKQQRGSPVTSANAPVENVTKPARASTEPCTMALHSQSAGGYSRPSTRRTFWERHSSICISGPLCFPPGRAVLQSTSATTAGESTASAMPTRLLLRMREDHAARQRRGAKWQQRRQQHSRKAARIKRRARAQAQRIDCHAGQKHRCRQRKVFHIHAHKEAVHNGGLRHGQRTEGFIAVFAKEHAVGAQHIGKKRRRWPQ